MKRLVLILSIVLSGCNDFHQGHAFVVPEENKQECRAWVKACIEKANPMSDEEPEDMIRECLVTSSQLFGQCVLVRDRRQVYSGERCSLPVLDKETIKVLDKLRK